MNILTACHKIKALLPADIGPAAAPPVPRWLKYGGTNIRWYAVIRVHSNTPDIQLSEMVGLLEVPYW